jgi:hypothetical protein
MELNEAGWPKANFKNAALDRSAAFPDACRRGIGEGARGRRQLRERKTAGRAERIESRMRPDFESDAIAARSKPSGADARSPREPRCRTSPAFACRHRVPA